MSKRARSNNNSLTGGTGDVNPQFLSFQAVQAVANTTISGEVPLPIQRLQTRGEAQVVEVLKVYFTSGNNDPNDYSYEVAISTKNFGSVAPGFADPTVFAAYQHSTQFTVSGTTDIDHPFVLDLTDGAGHGILIGTDKIYWNAFSNGLTSVLTMDVKILYRFKNVSVIEYVGIVQSQQ